MALFKRIAQTSSLETSESSVRGNYVVHLSRVALLRLIADSHLIAGLRRRLIRPLNVAHARASDVVTRGIRCSPGAPG